MKTPFKPERLNKVIHERARLGIMSALAARDKLTFNELKQILELTDGNLSVHGAVLEENGLIRIKKDFEGKKPRTTFILTPLGRREFEVYLKDLEDLLKIKPA